MSESFITKCEICGWEIGHTPEWITAHALEHIALFLHEQNERAKQSLAESQALFDELTEERRRILEGSTLRTT